MYWWGELQLAEELKPVPTTQSPDFSLARTCHPPSLNSAYGTSEPESSSSGHSGRVYRHIPSRFNPEPGSAQRWRRRSIDGLQIRRDCLAFFPAHIIQASD